MNKDGATVVRRQLGRQLKILREAAGKKALLQAGVAVPIFAVTRKGKNLIIEKIRESSEQVLFKTTRLPALSEQQPEPLV